MTHCRRAAVLVCSLAVAAFAAPEDTFARAVNRYARLHQKLEKQLPALRSTGRSATIENHEHALARKIRAARANARQGEIFTPEVARYFRQLVRRTIATPDADRVRSSLQSAEPVRAVLRVNEAYPAGAPLQSTPPTLLASFPRLPAELDYRIVGRSLVLRDTIANVIVDFLPDLLPEPR